MLTNPRYWLSHVPHTDDFGATIENEFIDGQTNGGGGWAMMAPCSWLRHGVVNLGQGRGQRYKKQADGRWLKVEG